MHVALKAQIRLLGAFWFALGIAATAHHVHLGYDPVALLYSGVALTGAAIGLGFILQKSWAATAGVVFSAFALAASISCVFLYAIRKSHDVPLLLVALFSAVCIYTITIGIAWSIAKQRPHQ